MISWHFRVYQGPRSFRFDCPAIWFSQSHWSFWKTKAPNGFCPFVPQFMWKWWNMAVTYFQKLKNKRTSTTLRSVLWRPFVALLQNSFPLHPNQDTFPHHFPVHSRRAIAPLAPVQLSTFKVGSTWVKGSGDTFYHLQTILLPFPRRSNFRRTYLDIFAIFKTCKFHKTTWDILGPPNGNVEKLRSRDRIVSIEHFRCHQDAHLACEQKTSAMAELHHGNGWINLG